MSFFKRLLGVFNQNRSVPDDEQLIKQPEHNLAEAPPDELMVIEQEKGKHINNKGSP